MCMHNYHAAAGAAEAELAPPLLPASSLAILS